MRKALVGKGIVKRGEAQEWSLVAQHMTEDFGGHIIINSYTKNSNIVITPGQIPDAQTSFKTALKILMIHKAAVKSSSKYGENHETRDTEH